MENKTPIHTLDDYKNAMRDSFFASGGWCVIRFSEEQILLHPYECCKYIAQQIFELTDDDKYLKKLSFTNFPPFTPRWTQVTAEKMASKDTRQFLIAKAYNYASQLEYFPKNYFDEGTSVLLTKIRDWNEEYHYCYNNNFHGETKYALNKEIYPNLNSGQTVEIILSEFQQKTDIITDFIPPSEVLNLSGQWIEIAIVLLDPKK